MTDRHTQIACPEELGKEVLALRRRVRRSTWRFFPKKLSPTELQQINSRISELSKEIWKLAKACKYGKSSIRAINDPDEILREMKELQGDIDYPWFYYYGVNVDKEKLRSYMWYLIIKHNDLTLKDQALKYQTKALKVNKPEIIEYYKAERGIDLSSHSVIGVYKESDDPHAAERAMNKHIAKYGDGRIRSSRRRSQRSVRKVTPTRVF